MKWMVLLSVLYVGLVSCSSTQDVAVVVRGNNGDLSQKQYFEQPHYVLLDDENPEAVISHIDKVLFLKDRIVVVDITNKKRLLAFDWNGKYIASAEKLVGKGKNEYIQFSDCAVDTENQYIYMYCDRPYQFMVLDSNLNLLQCIKTDDFISEIAMDGMYLYAFCKNPNKITSYQLRRYAKKDLTGKYKVLLSFDKGVAGLMGMGHSLCSNDDHITFAMPFSNEIYEIKDGEVLQSIIVDFGDTWFSNEKSKHLHGKRFFKKNERKNWIIQNMVSSDSVMLFNTNLSHFYKINKMHHQGAAYKLFNECYAPYSVSWLIPYCGDPGYAVQEIPAEALKTYLKYCKEKKIQPAIGINTLAIRDSTQNPILQILKFK